MRNKRPVLQASFCLGINFDAGGRGDNSKTSHLPIYVGVFFANSGIEMLTSYDEP
jgi:hypothetical protein